MMPSIMSPFEHVWALHIHLKGLKYHIVRSLY